MIEERLTKSLVDAAWRALIISPLIVVQKRLALTETLARTMEREGGREIEREREREGGREIERERGRVRKRKREREEEREGERRGEGREREKEMELKDRMQMGVAMGVRALGQTNATYHAVIFQQDLKCFLIILLLLLFTL